jgi:putative Holliday junction resolvase
MDMPNEIFLGFDFGFKRIGMAVGQRLTCTATPLTTLKAVHGVPDWSIVAQSVAKWRPSGLVVGFPTCLDGKALYTTKASKRFADALEKRFFLPVHLVDERLSTIEARSYLFEKGGYRQIQKTEVDSIAACIILERFLEAG